MNKFILLITFLCSSIIYAYSAPVEPYLTVSGEAKVSHGMAIKAIAPEDVYPLFKSGLVMNTGTDEIDDRNFGKYIETYSEYSYDVNGESYTDLIFIIYSNLSEVNVKPGDVFQGDTVLGKSAGNGTPVYPGNSNLFIYIYTLEPSPYLLKMTSGRFIRDGDFFWWDPSFLVK